MIRCALDVRALFVSGDIWEEDRYRRQHAGAKGGVAPERFVISRSRFCRRLAARLFSGMTGAIRCLPIHGRSEREVQTATRCKLYSGHIVPLRARVRRRTLQAGVRRCCLSDVVYSMPLRLALSLLVSCAPYLGNCCACTITSVAMLPCSNCMG